LRSVEETLRQLNRRVKALEDAILGAPTASIAEGRSATMIEIATETPVASPVESDSTTTLSPPHEERPLEPTLPPPEPPQPFPALQARLQAALWDFFFGENALVRIGVIVLFFGVGFLLKYAVEHIYIPIEVRLMAVAVGATVMLAIGWRLRLSRPGYALIVQGGGVGVLYLTVFAAFRLYQLLPAGGVLALLVGISVFSAMLAVTQDSRSLAAMGVSGGFLSPVIASTGSGDHVMLFSFYALLNLGILGIAWHKAWRSLNLLGFIFTFVIGLFWSSRYYRPELFASTEPFLILFFLFYVAIAVLFALHQQATITNSVDGTLIFGTPLIAFGLQIELVRGLEYGAALSALALSFFYLALAKALYSRSGAHLRLLVESFIALGVVFGTLAIPLAFDGRWTSAAWALEGAAIVWIGVRQEKRLSRAFGLALQFGAGGAFLLDPTGQPAALAVLNSAYLGAVFVSVGGLFCAWYLKRHRERVSKFEETVSVVLFGWGVLWWFGAGINEIRDHVSAAYRAHGVLLFVSGSCSAFSFFGRRIDWPDAKFPALGLLGLMYVLGLIDAVKAAHPLESLGYIAWPIAFATHLWLLHRHEKDSPWLRWWHAAGLWLFAGLGAWELAWLIGETVGGGQAWGLVGWALMPGLLLAWLITLGERPSWPVARHLEAYLSDGAAPLVVFLWGWVIFVSFKSSGDATPLPYLPLFNPLDLVQAGALLTLFLWYRRVQPTPFALKDLNSPEVAYSGLGIASFVWMNGILARSLHHWADVPFRLDAMLRSMLAQSAFSIFWSVLALCSMLSATRLGLRPLWLIGAGLMGVVVAKLFFIDLSNVGGVERIVSFIGVGLLMLLIGYVSPVPPPRSEVRK
jgi:uncharacterized membrane protein